MLNDIEMGESDISFKNGNIVSELIPILNLYKNKNAKQFSEVKQTKLDLQLAQSQFINITHLADVEDNYILKYSLWFSACVIYMRCFNRSDGREFKLNKHNNIDKLDVKYINAHKEIYKQRNTYMAHAGKNELEQMAVFAVLDFDLSKIIGLSNSFNRIFVPNDDMVITYSELTGELIKQVAEIEDELTNILMDELYNYPINKKSIIQPKINAEPNLKADFYTYVAKREYEENNNLPVVLEYITKAINELPDQWERYKDRAIINKLLGDIESYERDKATAERLKAL